MAKHVWTDVLNRKLIGMYKSNKYSTSEMANVLGVSQPTVYNHLKRLDLSTANLPSRHRAAVKFEFSAAERRKILRLHNEGNYFTDIALALGRTIGPIWRVCKELGLKTSNFKPAILGETFGYLKDIAHAPAQRTYKGHLEGKCIVGCDCGKQKEVFNYNLRSGNTKTCGCKIHLLNPDTPYINVFHRYLSGATSRGLELRLNLAQMKYLIHQKCFYCKTASSNSVRGRIHGRSNKKITLEYMGIDRTDSSDHYYAGNVLPACIMCNRAKSNSSLPDFVAWLNRLGRKLTEREILQEAKRVGKVLQKLG
jgi:transposase